MDPAVVVAKCDQLDALFQQAAVLTQEIRAEVLTPVPPPTTVVRPGEDLQAALDAGGPITLAGSGTFHTPGGYRLTVPGTSVTGTDTHTLSADTAAALTIPPALADSALAHVAVQARSHEVVVQVGRNDEQQVTLPQVPMGVRCEAVTSTGHRGKRVFELNAGGVELLDCSVLDCLDPEGLDSQAVWVGNAPGPVVITGGIFEAASECFLAGGDTMKLPGVSPTGLRIRHAVFRKPLSWKDTGVAVKNLLELKHAHDVLVEACVLRQCWKSAQDGYAFMLTPTRGGSLRNVVIRDCDVSEVGGIVNITGLDSHNIGTLRTQVTIIGGTYRTNKTVMGGSGRFCLITRGPELVRVEGVTVQHEGSAFVDIADKAPVDLLQIRDSTWNYGTYGVRIGGLNHGDNSLGVVKQIDISGNTISGAHSAFRTRYPHNTYPSVMSVASETHQHLFARKLRHQEEESEAAELAVLEASL